MVNRCKYSIIILIIMTAMTNSCKNKYSEQNSSISKLFENYYEEKLSLNPLEATMIGDSRYNHVFLNDISESHRAALKAFYSGYQNKLKEYDRNTLSEKDRLGYDILNYECVIQLEELQFHSELIPINQFESMHLTIGQFAGGTSVQPFKTVKDYENWLSRLDGFSEWCDTAVENMKRGMRQGYVLQKVLAEKVIDQFASLDHGSVKEHLFYKPVLTMPKDFSDADKEKITKAYEDKINNKIIPSFKKLHDFFKNEYLPVCRKTDGLSGLPDGKKFYEHKVRYYTTTDLTPDEIFETGKKEVQRITMEMEKVKKQVGYKGDLISFFNFVRTDKKLMPYKNAEEVIAHFNAIYETIKPNLKNLFDLVPKSGFEIKRTEAFREKTASAEYMPGSWDGSRPGMFYVPVPNASEYNVYADEDLFLHEAIPGHHYQISIQQEDTTLPKFRRGSWYGAYGEGWALYTESLGKDLRLYTDPFQYFGMLSMEMHRSIRLVVDVGIHCKGWTREEAIKYSLEHEAEPESMIISEIERYMAYPGQALSYKIGQIKILELRAKAEKSLGSKFNIREFHNKMLESGCLPLTVLEDKINKWIDSKK
jgi:uncharacterized protein (DUF885 family)